MSIERDHNARAAGRKRHHGIDEDFAADDRLPVALRTRLQQGHRRLSAVAISELYESYLAARVPAQFALALVLKTLATRDQKELRLYGRTIWPKQCGAYPHLAAGASVLR